MTQPRQPAILGLDLAERLGICVLDWQGPKRVWSATIQLANRDPQERLLHLKKLLDETFSRFPLGVMAVEDVFLPARTSRRTPISLGELRGVARLAAAEQKIPVFFYTPAQVKLAITGSGRADKADVVRWIETEFRHRVGDHNEADAISIAYTHWLMARWHSGLKPSQTIRSV
jgi:crossover junction endodeoxyribonuclease RuvC